MHASRPRRASVVQGRARRPTRMCVCVCVQHVEAVCTHQASAGEIEKLDVTACNRFPCSSDRGAARWGDHVASTTPPDTTPLPYAAVRAARPPWPRGRRSGHRAAEGSRADECSCAHTTAGRQRRHDAPRTPRPWPTGHTHLSCVICVYSLMARRSLRALAGRRPSTSRTKVASSE